MGESIKANPRLWMEFFITVAVLLASFIILALPTPDIVNQGAYQLCTLTLGFWFGRGTALYQDRRRNGNGNGNGS